MIVMKDGRKDSVEEKNLQVINICYKTCWGGGRRRGQEEGIEIVKHSYN